jgi:subtilisin family serine protease
VANFDTRQSELADQYAEVLRQADPAFLASVFAAGQRGETSVTVPFIAFRDEPHVADEKLKELLIKLGVKPKFVVTKGKISIVEGATGLPPKEYSRTNVSEVTPDELLELLIGEDSPLGACFTVDLRGAEVDGKLAALPKFDDLTDLIKLFAQLKLKVDFPVRISSSLDYSVPAIRARPADLPAPPTRDGRGVVIGVADWGCDFAHPAFLQPDGSTRLLYLWDQNEPKDPTEPVGGGPFGYGRLFDAKAINDALTTENPYYALDYTPDSNPPRDTEKDRSKNRRGGSPEPVHGTHVAGVAAGSAGPGLPPGVAPGADIIFVHLRPDAVSISPHTGSFALAEAVIWIIVMAIYRAQPVVINLSLGTNAGPHDGTTCLDAIFDLLLEEKGRAIVVAAGNAADENLHASGRVAADGEAGLTWRIEPNSVKAKSGETTYVAMNNVMDIWYESPDAVLSVTLVGPKGRESRFAAGLPYRPINYGRRGSGGVWQRLWDRGDPLKPLQWIHIELKTDPREAQKWRVVLSRGEELPGSTAFDAWIDLAANPDAQSAFASEEADKSGTLASLACGKSAICVGAYYEIPSEQPAAYFTSQGPTRRGCPKPDVAAPGWEVHSANAYGGRAIGNGSNGTVPLTAPMSGTSVSAPHVSGLAALLLQRREPSPDIGTLTAWIKDWTQLKPPTFVPPFGARNWDPRIGAGRIDAAQSLWNQR